MSYLLQHLLWFFLPGLLLLYLCCPRQISYLAVFALSYVLLLLNLLPLEYLGAAISSFTGLLYAELALLVLLTALKIFWRRRQGRGLSAAAWFRQRRRRLGIYGAALVLGLIGATYWLWAGPYTEIPADIWAHLGRIQDQNLILEAGRFKEVLQAGFWLSHQHQHWYFIEAWLCQQSGLDLAVALPFMALANALTFILGFFSFGLFLFRRLRRSLFAKAVIAAAAALFGAAHLGVNVFSYIRYYTLAPALFNYGMFLAAAALGIAFLESDRGSARRLLFLPLLAALMFWVHTPELIFLGVLLAAVSVAALLLAVCQSPAWRELWRDRRALAFYFLALGGIGLFIWMRWRHPGIVACPAGLRPLAPWAPLLKHALILKPLGPFLEVVTLWGILVYLVFALRWRAFLKQPAIIGGMLLPLLSVFNPFVIDMFLRHGPTGGNYIYRLGYALPLAYVAGFLAVEAIYKLWRPPEASFPWKRRLAQLGRIGLLLGLLLLLGPMPPALAAQSRWLTLRPVAAANSEKQWGDLLSYLRGLPPKAIIADPVTAYVVQGLTKHSASIDKFLNARRALYVTGSNDSLASVCRDISDDLSFDGLLIINHRDGAFSKVGQVSRHWPGNVLAVSQHYSASLVDYVQARPECFGKLWASAGIAVYQLKAARIHEHLPQAPEMIVAEADYFHRYGYGIRLDWTSVAPLGFQGYQVQFSDNGIDWKDLRASREYRYSWLYHLGDQSNAAGTLRRCLPSGKTYYYRVRALYDSGASEWSKVKTATVASYP